MKEFEKWFEKEHLVDTSDYYESKNAWEAALEWVNGMFYDKDYVDIEGQVAKELSGK